MEHKLTGLHVPMIKETRRVSRSMINGKDHARTYRLGHLLSRRILSAALALLSNTKKLQHFHLPFCTFLLKKINRKVHGVPQAQVAASTMMAGSKTHRTKPGHVNTKNMQV